MPDQIVSGPTTLTAYQASYHWRNKNCYPWASQWFKTELPGTSIEEGGHSAEITEVTEVDGDVDLGQRKGKVLTIYDCRVVMNWKGTTSDGEELTGKLTIPEVSHEMIDGHNEYQYDFSTVSNNSFRSFLRASFPPVLAEKLDLFPKVLVQTHGQPSSSTPEASGSTTPVTESKPVEKSSTQTPAVKQSKDVVGGTSSVSVEVRLQASAEDVWLFLTDEKRVPVWTRAPAKVSVTPGSSYEMFGGNVVGKLLEAEQNKKLVQSWQLRSPTWPSDHFATLTTTLNQGSDSTLVNWSLAGVPKGQEETLRGAVEGYYVNGFKQIGLVVSVPVSHISEDMPSKRPLPKQTKGKALRKKTTKSSSATESWDWVPILLAAGSVVGFVGIVWGSLRQ